MAHVMTIDIEELARRAADSGLEDSWDALAPKERPAVCSAYEEMLRELLDGGCGDEFDPWGDERFRGAVMAPLFDKALTELERRIEGRPWAAHLATYCLQCRDSQAGRGDKVPWADVWWELADCLDDGDYGSWDLGEAQRELVRDALWNCDFEDNGWDEARAHFGDDADVTDPDLWIPELGLA